MTKNIEFVLLALERRVAFLEGKLGVEPKPEDLIDKRGAAKASAEGAKAAVG